MFTSRSGADDLLSKDRKRGNALVFSLRGCSLHPPFATITSQASSSTNAGAGSILLGKARTEAQTGTQFAGQLCHTKTDCRDLSGVAVRQKRILGIKSLDIYAIALFVEPQSLRRELSEYASQPAAALAQDQSFLDAAVRNPNIPKTLQIVVTSAMVTRAKLLDALRERMEPALDKFGKKALVDDFSRQFDSLEVKKGTSIVFSTTTGGGLVTSVDGKKIGQIAAPEVGKALLGIYLGSDPVQRSIKDALGEGLAGAVAH